jgi:2-C-methyl-D-erythritol 4-phosphate cytidylyltransferase
LLEKFTGIKVKLIPGTEMNFKITTEDDFQLARAIIRMNKDKI